MCCHGNCSLHYASTTPFSKSQNWKQQQQKIPPPLKPNRNQTKNPQKAAKRKPNAHAESGPGLQVRYLGRDFGLISTSRYGTTGLSVQPVPVCAGSGRSGATEPSRGHRLRPGSLGCTAGRGEATPAQRQRDGSECVHARSSACIAASGAGGVRPPLLLWKLLTSN